MNPLLQFSLLWSRVAVAFYAAGLAAAVVAALQPEPRRQTKALGVTRALVEAGLLFQIVSLVEEIGAAHLQPLSFLRLVTSLLAFVIAAFFLMIFRAHRPSLDALRVGMEPAPAPPRAGIAGSPRALSLLVLPLLVVLAATAAFAPPGHPPSPSPVAANLLHNGWIYLHITLIFLGYAGLVVAMGSSLIYLFAQRALKAKNRPNRSLPPLETLDLVAYRALVTGFPLLTAGLVIGAYWADQLFGGISLRDPTVALALLVWLVYLVLLFVRWSQGWRGRRTAFLTLICFGLALAGWFANGFSHVHSIFLH